MLRYEELDEICALSEFQLSTKFPCTPTVTSQKPPHFLDPGNFF